MKAVNNSGKCNACGIVCDLLPLYVDGVCSEDSRELIEEHIAECSECREMLGGMRSSDEERVLGSEKRTALIIHGKMRDGRILKSILWAIAAAYVPLVFIAPLFARNTGLVPTNYPFKLLVVFLFTLPFLTSLLSLGFTVSKVMNWRFFQKRMGAYDITEAVAAIITAIACFNMNEMLYIALFGSAVSIILWVINAVRNKHRDINKRTFFICFIVVFTAFLAFIIAFSSIVNNGEGRPEKDEYDEAYSIRDIENE